MCGSGAGLVNAIGTWGTKLTLAAVSEAFKSVQSGRPGQANNRRVCQRKILHIWGSGGGGGGVAMPLHKKKKAIRAYARPTGFEILTQSCAHSRRKRIKKKGWEKGYRDERFLTHRTARALDELQHPGRQGMIQKEEVLQGSSREEGATPY